MLEESVPQTTRCSSKWPFKMFKEWQIGRVNKDASLESYSLAIDKKNNVHKYRQYDSRIAKFVPKGNQNGDRYASSNPV